MHCYECSLVLSLSLSLTLELISICFQRMNLHALLRMLIGSLSPSLTNFPLFSTHDQFACIVMNAHWFSLSLSLTLELISICFQRMNLHALLRMLIGSLSPSLTNFPLFSTHDQFACIVMNAHWFSLSLSLPTLH